MRIYGYCAIAGAIGLGLTATSGEAAAGRACVHTWAMPGEYRVSGNFRGQVETARARLSTGCRIHFDIPGVFSGRTITGGRDQCVSFSFKVEGQDGVFAAEWCEDYAIIPWNGEEIRAEVSRVRDRSD